MDKLVGMDTVTKFVVPFDLKSVQWMPDDVRHISQKGKRTGQCRPTEDEMNNSDVIQRLSLVKETKGPAKQRNASPLSQEKPSDLVPLSKLSQQSRKPLTRSSGVPVETVLCEGQADGCSNKMMAESQEHGLAVQSFDMDTHTETCRQEYNNKIPVREGFGDTRGQDGGNLLSKPGTDSARWTLARGTQQHVGVNQSPATAPVARTSNTDRKWRECLSRVEVSAQTKRQNIPPVNETLRHLRERQQRPHMDWSTSAKAILASRNQQQPSETRLPNVEPNEMRISEEEIREWPSKQTLQRTKRRMPVSDRLSAKKSARQTQPADIDPTFAQDNDACASDLSNEINNVNPLISSSGDIDRSAVKNRTERDIASVFSFL